MIPMIVGSIDLPSLDVVVHRMAKRYASIRTYRDHFQVWDVLGKHRELIGDGSFEVEPPKQFRFVLRRFHLDEKITVEQDRSGRRYLTPVRLGRGRRYSDRADLDESPPIHSTPFEVVSLILGKPGARDQLVGRETISREVVDGRPCFRLSTHERLRDDYVWLDAKTYLIVKIRACSHGKIDFDQVYRFHPRAVWR